MNYSKNQFSTLLTYIVLLLSGSILTAFSLTGTPYFLIITLLAVVATGIMIYLTKQSGPNELEAKTSTQNKIIWVIIGAIGAIILQLGLGLIEQNLLHLSTSSQNTTQMLTMAHSYPYYFVYILFCAPLMEEIIFRRVFFSNLNKITNIYLAAIISALFFAFMHQDTRFVIYVAMGLWFSYVYYKSKNIYVSAFSHIIMNAVVLAVSL
jgi:Predicted metal-dependent membrane protease